MFKKQMFLTLVLAIVCPALMFGAATISGKITYTGTPMKAKPIDMTKEPSCAAQHATPVMTETVVTGANNSLANVVVYISAGATDEGTVPSQAVTYEQKGCQYLPHILAMHVNQPLKIVNSDQTSHNIHPLPKLNSEWNKSQPSGSAPIDAKFDKDEFIPVKCNIHPWMHGYMAVVKGPYAVSGENGTFTVEGVPPGSYTLSAWQETYGAQTQKITVAAGKPTTADFTFKAK